MADARKLAFAPFAAPAKGVLVLFCEEGLKFGPATRKALAPTGDLVQRAAAADQFTGKSGSALDIVAPAGLPVARLAILGVGKAGKLKAQDFVKLGGAAMGKVPAAGRRRHDLRGTCRRRAEAGPGRRHRARRAAARLCVRSLQDQAQGGRGGAGQGRKSRSRSSNAGGGAEGLELTRGAGRRRRHHRARSGQRAGQRALSGGIRAPGVARSRSSASRSKCST